MPVAVDGTGGRRGASSVEDRQLDHRIQQSQRLVVSHMLLRLRCNDIRQQEMGGDVRHGWAAMPS